MTEQEEPGLLTRIVRNPDIFDGKPIVRGKRITVEFLVTQLAIGVSRDALLEGYPFLEAADLDACLLFAARAAGRIQNVDEFQNADAAAR